MRLNFDMTKYQRKIRNLRMTKHILMGASLEEAAHAFNMNSRQAVLKVFRLTLVNFFFATEMDKIKNMNYNIRGIRKIWRDALLEFGA